MKDGSAAGHIFWKIPILKKTYKSYFFGKIPIFFKKNRLESNFRLETLAPGPWFQKVRTLNQGSQLHRPNINYLKV